MNHHHISSSSRKELEERRMNAAGMFKKGYSQTEVAKKFRVSAAAASQWHAAWTTEGVRGLKSKGSPGPEPTLTDKERAKIRAAILKGPKAFGYDTNLWTLERIAAVMQKVAGHSFGITWTWHLVIRLGFSCQQPVTRARERDEKAITSWKRSTFPVLKKIS